LGISFFNGISIIQSLIDAKAICPKITKIFHVMKGCERFSKAPGDMDGDVVE